MTKQPVEISRLGQRGEGVAEGPGGPVFVPYALPGEWVMGAGEGDPAGVEIVTPRPDRVAPVCSYFGTCGGCAVQALPSADYAGWKRSLVVDALRRSGLDLPVAPLVAAHGEGRRRATFHARLQASPNIVRAPRMRTGFMRARSHEVIDVAACPILAPTMAGALDAAHRIAGALAHLGKPLDLLVTASDAGLDVDLRGLGRPDGVVNLQMSKLAAELDLARLSNHGNVVVERRAPTLRMGVATVALPPGAFLQATAMGEAVMAKMVCDAVGSARRVADLFCGLGTFALRLAERATVTGYDTEGPSLAALRRAARGGGRAAAGRGHRAGSVPPSSPAG